LSKLGTVETYTESVRPEALTAVTTKITASWDVESCNLENVYCCSRQKVASIFRLGEQWGDGGYLFFQNVGTHLPNYTALILKDINVHVFHFFSFIFVSNVSSKSSFYRRMVGIVGKIPARVHGSNVIMCMQIFFIYLCGLFNDTFQYQDCTVSGGTMPDELEMIWKEAIMVLAWRF
jgi:hypothetical protein